MKRDLLIINKLDNVGVLLKASNSIPAAHKVALLDIKKGEKIIKYGEVIGYATKDIYKGEWVHTHNIVSHLNENFEYEYHKDIKPIKYKKSTFKGYKRNNRRAGIRNDIYIIPTVGCVNSVCKKLEELAKPLISGSIDNIMCLTHQFGCSQLGEDNENIKKLLCSIALNPNATYVLFVGLGCENNKLEDIQNELKDYNHIKYLIAQKEDDEVAKGFSILKEFINSAKDLVREDIDMSELCIGLKCGGSDGFSGITANPTVGRVSDAIISFGGSAILTEVPEMFGAEQILMNKCKDVNVYNRYKKLILDFKDYYIKQGFPVYENPSPGNKEGGISTLEEKSLGCITKAGNSEIVDVLNYGELVKEKGLSILDGPGNDLIAATSLGASGCQVVLFTTGRGTPFSTFVPTLKISSNNFIGGHKPHWIDFNAYPMGYEALYSLLMETVNGTYKTKSESNHEIAFYKKGVTL